MKYRNAYTKIINHNCAGPQNNTKDLAYWRNNLFATTIIYLLPFCLIALLPGLYLCILVKIYMVVIVDLITITGMLLIAFAPGINLDIRKFIFIFLIYVLSCTLLYYLGVYGPGLIYLLGSAVFTILIIPAGYKFWPAWLNTAICLLFALAVLFKFVPWRHDNIHLLVEWLALSSSVVFLSFLLAALLPQLFNGLQETINMEKRFKEKLDEQHEALKDALDKVQQKNIELEQFAYVVSHDLKEPVRMISSFMALLKSKYASQLDKKAGTYVDFALDGAVRMQKMIGDLLELSRTARRGGMKEMIDLNEIFKEVQINILKLIEENNAKIITDTMLPILYLHRDDITRLLQNLLTNAIKFRNKEQDPIIHVKAIEKEHEWLFSIKDNGIGIEEENFERIFEVFTRLHKRDSFEGTGIGLAICKKIVEQNGGDIYVESAIGKGTTFYFTIKI